MIRTKPLPASNGSIELTPLIDIIFIVIVFLLLTANTRLLQLPVAIPSSAADAETASPSTDALIITLQAEAPHWAINEQHFADWQVFKPVLLNSLALAKSDQQVTIAPAFNAEVQPLVQLLSLLNQQQITNTQILMNEQD